MDDGTRVLVKRPRWFGLPKGAGGFARRVSPTGVESGEGVFWVDLGDQAPSAFPARGFWAMTTELTEA